ncbi:MAG: GNAT family N-acetyltransferase [Actinomycetota bacterium]|nr:GNAT family N-acetyltransferase [Actinomycetota bacterium]
MTDDHLAGVRDRYGRLASDAAAGRGADDRERYCGASYAEDELAGLPGAAVTASLGCGNPFALADLHPGEDVLDLGSGGGIDVLLSARRIGPDGTAHGVDATAEMVDLARANAAAAGVTNAVFHEGSIDRLPLPDASVDVVLSNCVVNLVADKAAVFAEVRRVLRPGGRVAITDLVVDDALDAGARERLGRVVDCAAGALTVPEYRAVLATAGLRGVTIEATHDVDEHVRSVAVRAVSPLVTSDDVVVRLMVDGDWPAVAAIYAAGIATGDATFETEVPSWDGWRAAKELRLVAVDGGDRVLGWAAGSAVSDRCVYGGVMEHGIYVDPAAAGRGVGTLLLRTFLAAAERAGIWTVQSGIFPENRASLALHERCGFRVVGRRERLGSHHGRWRDVLLVEHRSATVGCD